MGDPTGPPPPARDGRPDTGGPVREARPESGGARPDNQQKRNRQKKDSRHQQRRQGKSPQQGPDPGISPPAEEPVRTEVQRTPQPPSAWKAPGGLPQAVRQAGPAAPATQPAAAPQDAEVLQQGLRENAPPPPAGGPPAPIYGFEVRAASPRHSLRPGEGGVPGTQDAQDLPAPAAPLQEDPEAPHEHDGLWLRAPEPIVQHIDQSGPLFPVFPWGGAQPPLDGPNRRIDFASLLPVQARAVVQRGPWPHDAPTPAPEGSGELPNNIGSGPWAIPVRPPGAGSTGRGGWTADTPVGGQKESGVPHQSYPYGGAIPPTAAAAPQLHNQGTPPAGPQPGQSEASPRGDIRLFALPPGVWGTDSRQQSRGPSPTAVSQGGWGTPRSPEPSGWPSSPPEYRRPPGEPGRETSLAEEHGWERAAAPAERSALAGEGSWGTPRSEGRGPAVAQALNGLSARPMNPGPPRAWAQPADTPQGRDYLDKCGQSSCLDLVKTGLLALIRGSLKEPGLVGRLCLRFGPPKMLRTGPRWRAFRQSFLYQAPFPRELRGRIFQRRGQGTHLPAPGRSWPKKQICSRNRLRKKTQQCWQRLRPARRPSRRRLPQGPRPWRGRRRRHALRSPSRRIPICSGSLAFEMILKITIVSLTRWCRP
eukprot:jgi/Botrbrau1/12736/Bobra.67_1s0095.1